MELKVALPGEMPPEHFFDTRYQVLRKPLGAPRGSERIAGDDNAINIWIEANGTAVAVGRSHLIPHDSDGAANDTAAKSLCPPFSPLCRDYLPEEDDRGILIAHDLRPAFQIRQMGTLEQYRGQGLAATVLKALEEESVRLWHARTGWLQARIVALPFYVSQGWTCFGSEYDVPNVGPHRSAWKKVG